MELIAIALRGALVGLGLFFSFSAVQYLLLHNLFNHYHLVFIAVTIALAITLLTTTIGSIILLFASRIRTALFLFIVASTAFILLLFPGPN